MATVYSPRGGGPFPVLLDVHGGAWRGGSRTGSSGFHRSLAASGLVIAAIDFRLAPDHPYPGQVADVNYATRWLKAHAAGFGGDADVLGGIGSSSGGHTMMLSSMRPADPRYRDAEVEDAPDQDATLAYAVLRWAVLDPLARYQYAQRSDRPTLADAGQGFLSDEDSMREASPTLALERGETLLLPPALIVQGTADNNIPMSIPNAFVEAYRSRGGQVEMHVYEGMRHDNTFSSYC